MTNRTRSLNATLSNDSRTFCPVTVAATSCDTVGTVCNLTDEERSFFEGRSGVAGFRTNGSLAHFMRQNTARFMS